MLDDSVFRSLAFSHSIATGEAAEDDDSDDGLPPLERNMNHLSLEESEEDCE